MAQVGISAGLRPEDFNSSGFPSEDVPLSSDVARQETRRAAFLRRVAVNPHDRRAKTIGLGAAALTFCPSSLAIKLHRHRRSGQLYPHY